MITIARLLLLATTATASLIRRDATPLVNSMNNQIYPQLNTISSDVNAFPESGLNGSIKLDSDWDTLNTILDTATTLAQEVGTLGLLDTLNVVTAMEPIVTSQCNTCSAETTKVTDFSAIGRASFELSNLQILNIRWTAFTNELIALAPLGQAQALQAAQTTILGCLQTAIDSFSSQAS